MVKFFRTAGCPGCDAIQETLEDLCIACEIVMVSDTGKSDKLLPPQTRPPVLIDDGKIVQGSKNIFAHLKNLEKFKVLWEKYQSDACYCDEKDDIE